MSDEAFAAATGLPGPVAALTKLCLEHPVHPAAARIKQLHFNPTEEDPWESEDGYALAHTHGCDYPARTACWECHRYGRADDWWGLNETVWDSRGDFDTDPTFNKFCPTCADKLATKLGLTVQRRRDTCGQTFTEWRDPVTGNATTRGWVSLFEVRLAFCYLRRCGLQGREAAEAFARLS
jgi:hypothetical protein